MARSTADIDILWKKIEEENVFLPDEFWNKWEREFLVKLLHIQSILEQAVDISSDRANLIAYQIEHLINFLRRIKNTGGPGESGDMEQISMPAIVRRLMMHYLGNDLQRMLWHTEEHGLQSKAVMLSCISEIRDFLARLRTAAGRNPR